MSLQPLAQSPYIARGVRRVSSMKKHVAHTLSAPVLGLDVTQTLVGADPNTAIRLENFIPRVYGCEMRAGYIRWATGMNGEVRSLMNYQSPTNPRMFAGVSDGNVYDVSAQSNLPPLVSFTTTTADVPGEWSYCNFANDFGTYLLAVCPGAGYWIYDGTSWTQATQGAGVGQINGIDPKRFAYVMSWKGFVAFIEKDTADIWYLPYGQITGNVTEFFAGPQLPHGGTLAAMATWTVDAGDGMDDKLVLFGQQGDVVIYSGTDPNDASKFRKDGSWYVGRLPYGRRCVLRFSNDLAIVSERGLSFLSELLRGHGFFMNAEIAQRVNSEIAKEVVRSINDRYWEILFLPHEQLILINTPTTSSQDMQWAYEVNTKSFCTLVGMPMLSMESALGHTYFGDSDGNVWRAFEGDSDGALSGVPGKDLEGVVISAFMPFGDPVRKKIFHMVRPSFLAATAPAVKVALNPDWIFNAPTGSPIFTPSFGSSFWNSAIWNLSVWSGSEQSFGAWVGVEGMGYYGALAMKVRGAAGTRFVAWQAITEPGGIL